jgi:hypothetical protein
MKSVLKHALIAIFAAFVLIFISSTVIPFLIYNFSLEWAVCCATIVILSFWFLLKTYRRVQTVDELKEVKTLLAPTTMLRASKDQTTETPRLSTFIARVRAEIPDVLCEPRNVTVATKPIFLKADADLSIFGMPRGETVIPLEVEEHETVGTLKRRVAEIIGSPFEKISLKLGGREIEDAQTMKDLNLKGGESFTISLKQIPSTQSIMVPLRCPHCGSSGMYRNESGEMICIQCGARIPSSEK